MIEYNNEEYLKQEIMSQSRHQFIYGFNGQERQKFLKNLEKDFPVQLNSDSPMAIYVDEFGLPKVPVNNDELDSTKIATISREYLYFTIAYNILKRSTENINPAILNEKIEKILSTINNYEKNPDYPNISTLDDLISTLKESKEFYKQYYVDYVENCRTDKSIDDIAIPFIQLGSFISQYKGALNNNSYFALIIDKQKDIAISSTKAINLLVGARINKDISMKVAVEPEHWDTDIDFNGNLVEVIHDYGVVEFDNSFSQYVKKIKSNF